jgi:hypothetical protein
MFLKEIFWRIAGKKMAIFPKMGELGPMKKKRKNPK